MAARKVQNSVDPELEIAAAAERIIALSVAIEVLFGQMKSIMIPSAEAEAIPQIVLMIETEGHRIERAIGGVINGEPWHA